MEVMVGIGLVLEGEAFNYVREIEIALSRLTNNEQGLFQPPHITIKRPFYVKESEIKSIYETMSKFTKTLTKFSVNLTSLSDFNGEAIYLQVATNKVLLDCHNDLLRCLEDYNRIDADQFDADNFIAHCSVALDLSPSEFKIVNKNQQIKSLIKNTKTDICKLGLFLNVDDKHWIIIGESNIL